MIDRLVDTLVKRTARERRMLGLTVLVGVPLAVAFGILLPLQTALQAARHDHIDALALQLWVAQRAGEAATLAPASVPESQTPVGSSGLERGLIDVGLRGDVSDLGVGDNGVIELRFDAVGFTALANWVSAAQPSWGYDITRFRFEATEVSGKVSATLTLTPRS
tara:strand:- start:112509 stop:113000 length:492 start_codon:yes stop_codon:yes gene_type:complete